MTPPNVTRICELVLEQRSTVWADNIRKYADPAIWNSLQTFTITVPELLRAAKIDDADIPLTKHIAFGLIEPALHELEWKKIKAYSMGAACPPDVMAEANQYA